MRTKVQYRNDLRELAGAHQMELKMGNRVLDKANQQAANEVYRLVFPQRPHLWRKLTDGLGGNPATLSDGNSWPTDYVNFAGLAYIVDGGGNRTDFRYMPVRELHNAKTSSILLGTATDPTLWFSDKKIRTFPAAISGIYFEYFARNVQFYGMPDNTMSDIPNDLDPLVTRGALDRIIKLMVDENTALKLTQIELAHVEEANMNLFVNTLEFLTEGLESR